MITPFVIRKSTRNIYVETITGIQVQFVEFVIKLDSNKKNVLIIPLPYHYRSVNTHTQTQKHTNSVNA